MALLAMSHSTRTVSQQSNIAVLGLLQFVREFAKLGLTRSVGGVLALALSRELTPVVTCIIMAGDATSTQTAKLVHEMLTFVLRIGLTKSCA